MGLDDIDFVARQQDRFPWRVHGARGCKRGLVCLCLVSGRHLSFLEHRFIGCGGRSDQRWPQQTCVYALGRSQVMGLL